MIVMALSPEWRISADRRQWILQRLSGGRRWRPEAFCATREGLIIAMRRRGVDVPAAVRALPDHIGKAARGGGGSPVGK
jgi:hypothetical protein